MEQSRISANVTGDIVLVGNPNVGKSSLFNQLTGSSQKVANFPGITLHYLKGKMNLGNTQYTVVDLPGIYGFATNKIEEQTTHKYLIDNPPALILNIIDGRKLERNLSLTLQLMEMQIPMILILTFKDKIKSSVDLHSLGEYLNLPVILVNTNDGNDIKQVKQLLESGGEISTQLTDLGNLSDIVELLIRELEPPLVLSGPNLALKFPLRWLIIHSLLIGVRQVMTLPSWINSQIIQTLQHLEKTDQISDFQIQLIEQYYIRAEDIARHVLKDDYDSQSGTILQKVDNLLLDPIWGIVIFVLTMFVMFSATFALSQPINDVLTSLLNDLSALVLETVHNELLASFLADGIIGGIGFVLVFIPQIALLFFFIAIIEYTGYMARVVFITDQYLRKLKISGTSVAPLLLGFGCNVPGIMATRSIADPNERTIISLVNPFMSCSARLPVFIVIASALFPSSAGIVVTVLYFLGMVIALVLMYIFRHTILKGESTYLLMELPELEIPSLHNVVLQVYRHVREFVSNAASWMTVGLLVIWALSITGPSGYIGPAGLTNPDLMQDSWVYTIGSILSPLFSPMGWDVRLIVALILGFIAKEIVIGSLGLLYGVDSSSAALQSVLIAEFTPVSALAFMIFVLVYTPCIGAYFTLRNQVGKKWANFSILLGLGLGYLLAFVVSVVGNAIF